MKKILTLVFCLQFAANLIGQNGFIKGIISDSKNKETIVGGNVVVDDATGTVSDINGDYFFKTTAGKHKIEFKYVGFKSQIKNIEFNKCVM